MEVHILGKWYSFIPRTSIHSLSPFNRRPSLSSSSSSSSSSCRAFDRNGKGGNPRPSPAVDFSVFQFTLGIPGLDESQLPRLLGYSFGGLILLNHFLALEFVTAAQIRSELIGLFLAAVAINLPTIGKSLKESRRGKVATIGPNDQQVFDVNNNLTVSQKEELAWTSYALLKNTNTYALAIWYQRLQCVRGCWEIPRNCEMDTLKWLEQKLQKSTISCLTTSLYSPNTKDCLGWDLLLKDATCLLIQPFGVHSTQNEAGQQSYPGFLILFSKVSEGYSEKDRRWITFLANKLLSCFEAIHNTIW